MAENIISPQILSSLPDLAILDHVGYAISVQDTDFKIIHQNRESCEKMGSHIGKYCYQSYQNSRWVICRNCPLAESFRHGRPVTKVLSSRQNKSNSFVEISTSVIKDSRGKILAGIEIIKDSASQKKKQDHGADMSNMFDIINDAITIHDNNFNIIHANKAARKLLSITSNTAITPKCHRVYHGKNRPPSKCPSCFCLKTGKPATFELFEPNLNRHIEIRAFPQFDNKKQLKGLVHVVRDISARKKNEEKLQDLVKKLSGRTNELWESNIAFKYLLKQRELDKKQFEKKILLNVKHLIKPVLAKLKRNRRMSDELEYLNLLESNINDIISTFALSLSSQYENLTPREIEIANLIKDGQRDKDIAELLNISHDTMRTHRKNIRKKLGLYGKRTNLRQHLQSINN